MYHRHRRSCIAHTPCCVPRPICSSLSWTSHAHTRRQRWMCIYRTACTARPSGNGVGHRAGAFMQMTPAMSLSMQHL